MVDRIRRLFIPLAVPAWCVLGWRMLEATSSTQDTLSVGSEIVSWLDSHPLVAILLGFAWLILVVVWPDLKKKAPRFPKSQRERIESLEQELKSIRGDTEKIAGLEAAQIEHLKLDEKQGNMLNSLVANIRDISASHNQRLQSIEEMYLAAKFVELERKIVDAQQRCVGLLETSRLAKECNDVIDSFHSLRGLYEDNCLLNKPFAGWRLSSFHWTESTPSNVVRDCEKWAQQLESHLRNCRVFSQANGIPIVSDHITSLVLMWKKHTSDMPGEEFLGLLHQHQQLLWGMHHEIKNKIANT